MDSFNGYSVVTKVIGRIQQILRRGIGIFSRKTDIVIKTIR
jgi:hypothetical protein